MTNKDLEEIKDIQAEISLLEKNYSDRKQELCNVLRENLGRCDHVFPDGNSAIEAGFIANVCNICYWSDY